MPVASCHRMSSSGTDTHTMNATMADTSASGAPGQRVFELFSSLPKELRLEIWETAIPAERLIRVSLKPHGGRRYELAAAEPRYLQRNALGRPVSGERYRAVAEGEGLHSRFLRVGREARAAALRFYRVHVPAYLAGPGCTARATLYLNPEHDVLHVDAGAPVRETLVDFLWDLKAYDPRGVGLLKLAVDLEGFCANDLQYLRRSDLLLVRQRSALVETLSQLREVWFVNVQSCGRRRGLERRPEMTSAEEEEEEGLRSSWALPVRGGGPAFERLGRDERGGLEGELGQVAMGDIDPREMLFRWRRVLRTWEVEHGPGQVDYRVLVAQAPGWRGRPWRPWRAGGLRGAMESLELGRDGSSHDAAGRSDKRAAAVGFWLFPLEAIGAVGEGDKLSDMDFRPSRVLDMRDHWPELVLSKRS